MKFDYLPNNYFYFLYYTLYINFIVSLIKISQFLIGYMISTFQDMFAFAFLILYTFGINDDLIIISLICIGTFSFCIRHLYI